MRKIMEISFKVSGIIFSVQSVAVNNYRKPDKPVLCVLLKKENNQWKLPTANITSAYKIDDNISNIIKDQTGLKNVYSEQLYTYSNVISLNKLEVNQAYVALISGQNAGKLNDNCKWFILHWDEDAKGYKLNFKTDDQEFSVNVSKKLKAQTTDRYSFSQTKSKDLFDDHGAYIVAGLERLKNKIDYTNIVFNMMDKQFTLKYLQQVFEIIKNKKLLDAAFRRTIAGKVEPIGEEKRGSGHRPSMLYKFKEN